MSEHLTICYLTSRQDPKLIWWLDSLANQLHELGDIKLKIVVVSFYKLDISEQFLQLAARNDILFVQPKPCVWQGEHRLTKEDFFAASNARNTGLCLAPDGWIVYCDDLSVLSPEWVKNVRQSMTWNGVTLGAYKKVKDLVVERGIIKSFTPYPQGVDSRWNMGSDGGSVNISGEFLYGCSLLAPVELLLQVGGWPEYADGMSFEDVLMGLAMSNCGIKFRYNRNMLTVESEEHHHLSKQFRRDDYGVSPADKSHSALNIARNGCRYHENYYLGGIRKMREEVLSGKPFPIVGNPVNEWFTGKLLSEL